VRVVAVAALATVALAGCAGDDDGPGPAPAPSGGSEAATIKAWSRDVSAGRYAKAARYFARDAVVIQGAPIRLPDRRAAEAFNRSLPCRSTVTDVRRSGKTFVAAFQLRRGTGRASQCDQPVRVRFTFKGGKFAIFRQLPDQPAPSGDQA
jgi:hypothetical protein